MGQNVVPRPEPTSTDQQTGEPRQAAATLRYGGSTPINEVVFSEGRMQEELCFAPAANRTYRAPEGAPRSALGPVANLAKCFMVFANGETWSAAAAAGAGCQVPRGNPGACQVSISALEKQPPSQMHVAQSVEGGCLCPPTVGR